jgi:hypothetical protein
VHDCCRAAHSSCPLNGPLEVRSIVRATRAPIVGWATTEELSIWQVSISFANLFKASRSREHILIGGVVAVVVAAVVEVVVAAVVEVVVAAVVEGDVAAVVEVVVAVFVAGFVDRSVVVRDNVAVVVACVPVDVVGAGEHDCAGTSRAWLNSMYSSRAAPSVRSESVPESKDAALNELIPRPPSPNSLILPDGRSWSRLLQLRRAAISLTSFAMASRV